MHFYTSNLCVFSNVCDLINIKMRACKATGNHLCKKNGCIVHCMKAQALFVDTVNEAVQY
jgi:hypothetical protein